MKVLQQIQKVCGMRSDEMKALTEMKSTVDMKERDHTKNHFSSKDIKNGALKYLLKAVRRFLYQKKKIIY